MAGRNVERLFGDGVFHDFSILVVAGKVLKLLTASDGPNKLVCREQLQLVPTGGHGMRILHRRPSEGAGAVQAF